MSFLDIRTFWESRTRWEKTALIIGGVILLFVSVRVFISPAAKTVYPIFSASSVFWWEGIDLYEPGRPKWVQDGYRYPPAFAILLTPIAVLPDAVGGVLWRLISVGAFLGALSWLARRVLPGSLSRDQFALLVLLCLPLSLQSVNNGQANIIVMAALMAAVAAVKDERWNFASVMIALAFLCKIYPVALGMLLMLLYPRRLGWRIPLACVASLALPFLFQNPAYVMDQYDKWIWLLQKDDRSAVRVEDLYRDFWLLIRQYDLPISRGVYEVLQVAAGAGIAVLSWERQRAGWSEKALLTSTLALAAAWMMLLGPATESSSFVLLAPPLAWSLLSAGSAGWQRRLLLWGSASLFVVAVCMGGFTQTVKIHTLGVHSWASLLYFVYLLTERRPAGECATIHQSSPTRLAA